jgi:ketosteroid isomerase-like protein
MSETPPAQQRTELSVALLEEIVSAFNSRDPDRITAYFGPHAEWLMASGDGRDGRIVKGRDQIREVLAQRFEHIPNMHWEPLYDYVTGNRAVSVWHVTGNRDDGTVLNYRGCDLWEFEDGLVIHKDTYWKITESAWPPHGS